MSDDIKIIIADNIKRLRKLKNETAVELAESLGVSQSTISEWENGNKMPRAGAIEKLAQHYNVNKTDILNKYNPIEHGINENQKLIASHIDENVSKEDMVEILNFIEYVKSKSK